METKKVVFEDTYGILALASSPEKIDKNKESTSVLSNSNLKFELVQFIKGLPKRRRSFLKKR